MEQIIKSIIQIDRNAIRRQEEAQEELDLLGRQKKDLLLKLKSEMEAKNKEEIEAYREKAKAEVLEEEKVEIEGQDIVEPVLEEEKVIREEGEERSKRLDARYQEYADKISEETFRMILRSMEG